MLSFVAYFETLLQLSLHLCQFTCTLSNLGKKKKLFIIFLKNAYSAFFSILKRCYLWKMRGYSQFSFWISISHDMIYLSHIIWEKILPISGDRSQVKQFGLPDATEQLSLFRLWFCENFIFQVSQREIKNSFIF